MSVRWLAPLFLFACSDDVERSREGTAETFGGGAELRVPVAEAGRVFVKLGAPAVVTMQGDPKASGDWDLAFEGYDVFTNGGVSGGGRGGAFGPLDAVTFLDDKAPNVPFVTADRAGGAFLEWYAYDGSTHALYTRYHVYGVREGTRTWKVQVLGYYGERDGAVVPALYRVRWAEVRADGLGPTQEATGLDGTAGGAKAPATEPSECLDLDGARTMLTPAAAAASTAWHLCFRRAAISVNGGIGGPRGVSAVDLGAVEESPDAVRDKTPESERAAFDAVSTATFANRPFREDRVVSAFGTKWIDPGKTPKAPADAAWLVVGPDGNARYLVGVPAFEGASEKAPGVAVLRIKRVRE